MRNLLKGLFTRDELSDLNPDAIPLAKLESLLSKLTEEEVRRLYRHDPWLENYVFNVWEKVQGRTVLHSYPWHMAVSLADLCNAKCAFCTCSVATSGLLDLAVLPGLIKVARYARTLILTGGEPTVHPRFREIIKAFGAAVDPRCSFYMITNGDRLGRFREELEQVRMGFCVSLNAGTAATHHEIMQMGVDSFRRILENIRWLKSINRYVSLSFVVTRQSIHEVPQFIRLGNELNVDYLYVRTINPIQDLIDSLPGYSELPPYKHPQFEALRERAVEAIKGSRVGVQAMPEQWGVEVFSPSTSGPTGLTSILKRGSKESAIPKGQPLSEQEAREDSAFLDHGNPYGRSHPFSCNLVYYSAQVLDQVMRLYPCCFMPRVPGFEEMRLTATDDFFELWNSPALVALRRSLQQGPLYPACKTCTYQLEY
ncbi:MAG TPA: radical SAM/SPASM domain-containing protein [Pyrinomonadaceae bacterium]|jgi:MoaA/NifB/PqqE/SkfB family radical SAM enzyme